MAHRIVARMGRVCRTSPRPDIPHKQVYPSVTRGVWTGGALSIIFLLVLALFSSLASMRKAWIEDMQEERRRTDIIVRSLHKRIWQLETWHGWPPSWGSVSEAVRDHEHTREAIE